MDSVTFHFKGGHWTLPVKSWDSKLAVKTLGEYLDSEYDGEILRESTYGTPLRGLDVRRQDRGPQPSPRLSAVSSLFILRGTVMTFEDLSSRYFALAARFALLGHAERDIVCVDERLPNGAIGFGADMKLCHPNGAPKERGDAPAWAEHRARMHAERERVRQEREAVTAAEPKDDSAWREATALRDAEELAMWQEWASREDERVDEVGTRDEETT